MPQSHPYSDDKPHKLSGKATRQGLALEGKVYILRVVFCMTALALLTVNDAICRGHPGDHFWLLIGGLLYPHLGHLLFGRLDINRRRGHILFLADGMFAGAIIGALEFSLLPSLVLAVISLFNWMVVGGAALVALGLGFMFGGAMTTGMNPGDMAFSTTVSCSPVNWLTTLLALGYFLAVAHIVNRLVGQLRLTKLDFQARSDSASSAKNMAEQALLATLPPSAARQMAETGQLPTEVIQDATLLLLDFAPADSNTLALDDLKDAFNVATMILARHGIELIKTFGSQAIAVSRNENGPNDAFRAFLELDNFFKNHRDQVGQEQSSLSLRGKLHQGAVSMGLVQPERLNLDLCGEAANQLFRLSADGTPRLIVSASVYSRLANTADFVSTPSGSLAYTAHPAL